MKEWISKAEELYNQKKSYKEIGEILNVNRKTVSIELRKLGYKSNPKYVRNINPKKLSKNDYTYAETLFEKINNEEKAYWLGFLYADGNVSDRSNIVALALAEKDLEHLKKYREFFKLETKKITKKIKRKDNKEYIGYEFATCNQKIKNDLINLGCKPKKTYTLKFPTNDIVPQHLMHHFVRGYMDGDGAIESNERGSKIIIEILGTKEFLDSYQKWTGLHENKIHSFCHTDNVFHSSYGGPYAIMILDRLYKDATIYLKRKHDNYLKYRRLALKSNRTARLLSDNIGES